MRRPLSIRSPVPWALCTALAAVAVAVSAIWPGDGAWWAGWWLPLPLAVLCIIWLTGSYERRGWLKWLSLDSRLRWACCILLAVVGGASYIVWGDDRTYLLGSMAGTPFLTLAVALDGASPEEPTR